MVEIVAADLERKDHQQAVIELLDAYAMDPVISGKALPDDVKQDLIAGLQKHPTTLILLAYSDNRPVGIAVCFQEFSTFFAKPLLNLHDFGVLPEYRGQGIGQRLLHEVEVKAQEHGCCSVTLEVDENNHRARRVYRACGYEHSDRIPNSGLVLFLNKHI